MSVVSIPLADLVSITPSSMRTSMTASSFGWVDDALPPAHDDLPPTGGPSSITTKPPTPYSTGDRSL